MEKQIRNLHLGAKFFVVMAILFIYGLAPAGLITVNYMVVAFSLLGFCLSAANAMLMELKANEKKEQTEELG